MRARTRSHTHENHEIVVVVFVVVAFDTVVIICTVTWITTLGVRVTVNAFAKWMPPSDGLLTGMVLEYWGGVERSILP